MTSAAAELTTRGVKLAREQQLQEAIGCFEQAIRLDPCYALAHRNLGYARELLGDQAGAIACYRQVLEINPLALDTINRLGELLFASGAVGQAAECFERACALAPQNSAARSNL